MKRNAVCCAGSLFLIIESNTYICICIYTIFADSTFNYPSFKILSDNWKCSKFTCSTFFSYFLEIICWSHLFTIFESSCLLLWFSKLGIRANICSLSINVIHQSPYILIKYSYFLLYNIDFWSKILWFWSFMEECIVAALHFIFLLQLWGNVLGSFSLC